MLAVAVVEMFVMSMMPAIADDEKEISHISIGVFGPTPKLLRAMEEMTSPISVGSSFVKVNFEILSSFKEVSNLDVILVNVNQLDSPMIASQVKEIFYSGIPIVVISDLMAVETVEWVDVTMNEKENVKRDGDRGRNQYIPRRYSGGRAETLGRSEDGRPCYLLSICASRNLWN